MDTESFLQDLKQTAEEKAQELADSRTYVDKDGVVYEWDSVRNGWFPKVDEDFLATYQMNYGFTDEAASSSSEPSTSQTTVKTTGATTQDQPTTSARPADAVSGGSDDSKDVAGKKRKKEDPGWFTMDDSKNTNVYVSGLPLDITNEEFLELMSKYGIVMEDPDTKQPKLKLYRDDEGKVKGDGRCCYLKIESVELALQLLDETDYKGSTVHVQKAEFHMKGAFNPALKKKKKKNQKKKKQQNKKQEKLLDWVEREGTTRSKFDKIVIFKNMFEPKEIEEDPVLITEITDDVRAECEKHGEVKKIIVFDRHTDGVVSVAFKEQDTADQCIQAMNGRWFGGKKMSAERWDGVTNYRIEESDKEREQRLKKWEEYLQKGETKE